MKHSLPNSSTAARPRGFWQRIRQGVGPAQHSTVPHYWDDIRRELRESRDRLIADWTDGAERRTVDSTSELPENARAVILAQDLGGSSEEALNHLMGRIHEFASTEVQTVFLAIESQHIAVRALLGQATAHGESTQVNRTVLLRRIHLQSPFRLHREQCLRARFCQLVVLQLERSRDLDCGPEPAQNFHGCRVLYQVRSH